MTKQTRIVSFEDARAASRRSASRRASGDSANARQRTAARFASGDSRAGATRAGATRADSSRAASRTTQSSSAFRNYAQQPYETSRIGGSKDARSARSAYNVSDGDWDTFDRYDARDLRSSNAARDASTRDSRSSNAARSTRATRDTRSASSMSDTSDARDSRESRRRQRSKARADKMFNKQFQSDSASAEAAEGALRAALYEGKMGQKHRKSSKMQQSGQSQLGLQSGLSGISGMFSGIAVTPRSLKIVTVIACVFLALVFLYTPAQQYYQAQRELDRLTVEYSSIEQRNDALDVQNDALVSDAGMEDAVRQKYGYVKSGEETAVVTGLSDATTDTSRDSENIEANVLSSSVKAPEEWYTPLLDALFGVS